MLFRMGLELCLFGVWRKVVKEKSLKHSFSKEKRNDERTKHCVLYGNFFFASLMLCASAMCIALFLW